VSSERKAKQKYLLNNFHEAEKSEEKEKSLMDKNNIIKIVY
jgi:hypothetical protein